MIVRFITGSILKLQIPSGRVAYGVMLATRPYMAFYADNEVEDDVAKMRSFDHSPMFIIAVHKSAYSNGRWGTVLYRLPKDALPTIPLSFRQNVFDSSDCEIVDAEGRVRKVLPEECVNLERSAVWSAEHIEKRIED
jgi:hypothetical protein